MAASRINSSRIKKGTRPAEAPIRRKYHKDEYDIMLLTRSGYMSFSE
jgi:hypothetical protein